MQGEEKLYLSRDEVRAIDAAAMSELGIPGLVLMENAARGVADAILADFRDAGQIVVVCGFGNNGGDGLALARQLAACEIDCRVELLDGDKSQSSDASENRLFLERAGIGVSRTRAGDLVKSLADLAREDLIVDCLLGTGVRGTVRSPFDAVIAAMNRSDASVLAVDLPSGMDCDTGLACGLCVEADRTVTFVSLKAGFAHSESRSHTGKVTVAHIGLPQRWVRQWVQQQRSAHS